MVISKTPRHAEAPEPESDPLRTTPLTDPPCGPRHEIEHGPLPAVLRLQRLGRTPLAFGVGRAGAEGNPRPVRVSLALF